MTNIPTNTLIVVGTGEGASLYRNRGDVQNIKLELTSTLAPGDLADEGPSGKSPPEQSPQESMEATFSKILAEHLYKIAYGKKAEHIVLVLDPDTMGEVRPLLHKEVTARVILEHTKTLVNNPVEDIEKSLAAA
ncbi:host attachment family protein [Alphaproteobacteria bacterium]|nr:host attachment family protein [Alphaproteobacteria bacterium]